MFSFPTTLFQVGTTNSTIRVLSVALSYPYLSTGLHDNVNFELVSEEAEAWKHKHPLEQWIWWEMEKRSMVQAKNVDEEKLFLPSIDAKNNKYSTTTKIHTHPDSSDQLYVDLI